MKGIKEKRKEKKKKRNEKKNIHNRINISPTQNSNVPFLNFGPHIARGKRERKEKKKTNKQTKTRNQKLEIIKHTLHNGINK